MTAPRFLIMGDWLVEDVGHHTCGAGDAPWGHEPYCGLEPVVMLSELDEVLRAGFAVEVCHACQHRHHGACDRDGCTCPAPLEPPPPFCDWCNRVILPGSVHALRNGQAACGRL